MVAIFQASEQLVFSNQTFCYYLDYSEGRSDPIKRKLYPFEDEKIGLGHLKKLIDENVKKGWEKHNG